MAGGAEGVNLPVCVWIDAESKPHLFLWCSSSAGFQCDGKECQFISVFFSTFSEGDSLPADNLVYSNWATLIKMSLCHAPRHTVGFMSLRVCCRYTMFPLHYLPIAIGCCAAGADVRNCHLASLSCRKLRIKLCSFHQDRLLSLRSEGGFGSLVWSRWVH